jgi:FtsP/CotA-like multicopper oxidase with cupredoxin domain
MPSSSVGTVQPDTATDVTPDLDVTLRAAPAKVQILPGTPTTVWTYQAQVVHGDPASVQAIPGSYLGPIIRVHTGQRVRVTFINDLPEPEQSSIVHWHGMHVPAAMDGGTQQTVAPGGRFVYEFTVADRAGTYWFHPHPHGLISRQVLMGLAGLLIVSDAEEQAAGLPTGAQDVPVVIQDRSFDAQNQFVTALDMNQQMMGFLGERVLVNGQPDVQLDLATRAYRLRLLNGSNSRIYKLAWSDETPLTVIGSDGGLLAAPVTRPFVMLAPGERIELWADLRDRPLGTELTLRSLEFAGAEGAAAGGMGNMSGMNGMGGTASGNAPAMGTALDILRIRVARKEAESLTLPATLSVVQRDRLEEAVNRNAPRQVALSLQGMQWQINGKTYEMGVVAADEMVKLNTLEIWEIVNKTNAGGMIDPMGMAHPMHIHGGQFQVIGRTVLPELRANWEGVQAGYVDEGWKDTVLVMPGEQVQILMRFRDHLGDFVYHCHNLEHEQAGMMRTYRVVG